MKENPWLTFNQGLPGLARVQLSVPGSAEVSGAVRERVCHRGAGTEGSDLLMASLPSCLGSSLPGRDSAEGWQQWAQVWPLSVAH